MPTEQQIQTAQGALFLIDNVGKPPKDANFRAFTKQAIEEHLKRHSYYYQRHQKSDPANRTLVTMPWMRKYLLDLWKKVDRTFYEPRVPGDDATDTFLRKRSTRGFPDSVLSTYRYDRATFLESDLPPFEGHVAEESSDSEATETIERNSSNSRPQRTAAKPTWTVSPSRNSDELYDPKEVIDGNGSSEQNDGELDDDEDDGSFVDENDCGDFPSKDSASSTVALEESGRTISGSRGSLATKSLRSSQSIIEVQAKAKAFVNLAGRLVPRIKNDESSNQSKEGSSSVTAAAELGKRKRSDNGYVTQASSAVNEVTTEPTIEPNKRRASNATVSRGAKARRSSHLLPAAANTSTTTSEPRSETPAPTPGPVKHRANRLNDAQPVMDEVQDSQSTEHESAGPDIGLKDQSAGVDYNASNLNNEKLHKKLETATSKTIASIGNISQWTSSLDENPSDRLKALYTRCWGSNWKEVRVRLTEGYDFIALEVLSSLIAAYLFDNVLNQRESMADIRAKQLELKGPEGRAVLRILDLENKWHEFRQVIRAIQSEDAQAVLAQDHTSIAHQLHSEAQTLTKDLWGIIKPHFRSLSTIARCHGLASGLNERSWQETFETNITEFMEAVLRYRLELLASGREHVHTWPETDETYDLRYMDNIGFMKVDGLQVLFTVFPGTRLRGPDAPSMAEQAAKAKVKAQKR